MIQQRGSEAQAASRKCVSLLREIPQLSPDMPSMAMRTSIAKLCMELDLFNDACDILEMLLETTDKYAEVWYLCGVCYLHLNERDSAIEYFTGAGKTLTAVIQSGASDNGLGQSIVEMLKQAQALPSAPQEQKQQQQQQQGNGMDTAE
jgi:hypothetical protein